jgi:microcystin-dependent protein
MAQHDYVIDNQTAPNFRADLNNALAAIVSTNSGSSAPSTTYANMLWYDTTANILKMRNEADDTWIDLGTLNQSTSRFEPANAVPTGAVMPFASSSAPIGWLKANGAAVSRSTYATLFATIGTTFGAGDGSTTFNLPDMRGEFPRGWDDGRGVDSGRSFGSAQGDQLRAHTHTVAAGNSGGVDNIITTGNARSNDTSYTTSSIGGNETRPRNVALLYCIKF